jgi:hypothetical protein
MVGVTLAHAGHLLVDIPLFLGPVVILVAALIWSSRAERRREESAAAEPPTPRPGDSPST